MDRLKQKIIEQFAALCGLSITDAAGFPELIDNAIENVKAMLKDDINQDDEKNDLALSSLCGAICCYKYTILQLLNMPESVRTTDLTIQKSHDNQLLSAKLIKDEAILSARSLLKDDGFFFGRT